MNHIGTGKKGEDVASAYLQKSGYRIVERNYRCSFGEIDIIARDGETTVFVEVKTRKTTDYGDPQSAVDLRKQYKLSKIALHYLSDRKIDSGNARFDVVAVLMTPQGNQIELIRDAFDLACCF